MATFPSPTGFSTDAGGARNPFGNPYELKKPATVVRPAAYLPPSRSIAGASQIASNPSSNNQYTGASRVYAPDPYAKYGGQAAYNKQLADFNGQKANIYGTAGDAADNAGIGLRSSILDFVDSLRSGQTAIDRRGINAELAKQQGMSGILGMVGRGIRSGGVMLGNKNAGDSSAAGAIARAYGDIGRREATGVGQKYTQEGRAITDAQTDLESQRASGQRKIGESKEQVVNSIVADARDRLAQLDAAIGEADLPDRIAIEQEKANIKSQTLDRLSQYDRLLQESVASINPTSIEDRRARAAQMANEGIAASDAYQYTDAVHAEFANTGPFPSELPIFQLPRRPEEA